MRKIAIASGAAVLAFTMHAETEPRVICTLAQEIGSPEPLVREGACDERMSAASTFKIPISLMGFDSGILTASDQPEWQFHDGYVDWNPAWRLPTTPERWMRLSVVWFSQEITKQIGHERFANYVEDFDYGNKDLAGDAGEANGLTNAWLSSSLQISPAEQVRFLTRMVEGDLPVKPAAVEETTKLLELDEQPNGWQIFGKTGAGMPFGDDGNLLQGQPFGWYVGWAEKGNRKIAFARLVRFSERPETTPAIITRDGLINRLFGESGLRCL
ncbi:MAG: class D beta-lactamase [Mesorhizobium sp.]|nr:class D beta-lactamase [Mesorhizobium sp.]MCO5164704.1 class D beta-lactamase [Mesorhizobium sp.]